MSESVVLSVLSSYGTNVDDSRKGTRRRIKTIRQLTNTVDKRSGVYWIETNMPLDKLEIATEKERRKKVPEGYGEPRKTSSEK